MMARIIIFFRKCKIADIKRNTIYETYSLAGSANQRRVRLQSRSFPLRMVSAAETDLFCHWRGKPSIATSPKLNKITIFIKKNKRALLLYLLSKSATPVETAKNQIY